MRAAASAAPLPLTHMPPFQGLEHCECVFQGLTPLAIECRSFGAVRAALRLELGPGHGLLWLCKSN